MRNCLAIIPARGGSKRIPRKNIKEFYGRPAIAYPLAVAISCGLFAEVMVSTDDDEIAMIAKNEGASVPFMRSAKNSDDNSTTLSVIKEVLAEYKLRGREYDYVCCIYPTAVLMTESKLKSGYEELLSNAYDCVFPVVNYSHPIWRGFEIDEHNKASSIWPDYMLKRTQDLKPVFHDSGQWYWLNPHRIGTSIFTENTGVIKLSELEMQDIDTLMDWKLAELKYKILHGYLS